jgi:hypothetical protein
MSEPSVGAVLRQLQAAQTAMRKAREALREARHDGESSPAAREALRIGWRSLAHAHRTLAEVPLAAATDPVMTKQLAVQRYATALLVRLRRIVRNEFGPINDPHEGDGSDNDL